MPIVSSWWATVGTPGGGGFSSGSVSWRFPKPISITAQAAVGGFGGSDPTGEIGFSAFVQDGQFKTIGSDVFGSWAHVLFVDNVTQVDLSARSFDAWVNGSAVAYQWG